jgi:hypothetical protein
MKNLLLFTLLLFTGLLETYAQDTLKLTNTKSGKEIIFHTGSRIAYKLKQRSPENSGIISSISDSMLKVNNKSFHLNDLKAIGLKMQGADILLFGFYGISAGIFAYTYNNSVTGKDQNPVAIMALITSFSIATYIQYKNAPNKINKKWVLFYN